MILNSGLLKRIAAFLVIIDTFTRSNSTTSLGTSDTGQVWQALVGTWGISSNQAYLPSATTNGLAVVQTPYSDAKVSSTMAVAGSISPCISVRVSDASNYIRAGYDKTNAILFIQKNVNGTMTVLNSVSGSFAAGDVFQVIAKGSSIQLLKNGSVVCSATDTFNQTATMHGLACTDGSASLRWDSFKTEKA